MPVKILIVDDNDDFRAMVKGYLQKELKDAVIAEASTAEMGVAEALFMRPQIVLMDLRLPHVSGADAARYIKEDNQECDVIIVTMFETAEFNRNNIEKFYTAFIGKSELYERLMPVIRRCLKKHEVELSS
jgi:DNA-binding NarL/FixJ family response regulator